MTHDDPLASNGVDDTSVRDDIIDEQVAAAAAPVDDDDDIIMQASEAAADEADDVVKNEIEYPEDKIDFRGEDPNAILALIAANQNAIGEDTLRTRVNTVGTWENIMYRAIMENSQEERRIQESLTDLSAEERAAMSHELRGDGNKVKLRTSSIGRPTNPGETKSFTGEDALIAFEYQEKGGGYRIPLYNSGITIDVIVPTGVDVQTMLTNCINLERQLGAGNGAHYFTYVDVMYKAQILNFIQPLIQGSSYIDWRKRGALWGVIKIADLGPLVATIAALCYKDGFDGFITKCTRPKTEDHPALCAHTETITANIFEMITTRFSAMSASAIEFLVAARSTSVKHSLADIAKYQASLGFEGERLVFDNVTFVMRIPTLAEHLDGGSTFIADIINEIQGDNTEGQYQQFGLRYVRTFLPWIASVEQSVQKPGEEPSVAKTSDPKVIVRLLEKVEQRYEDDRLIDGMRKYINKIQLTYVGYPVTTCPSCGYTADTPSGLYTFDPFTAFFTLAFLYTNQTA